MNTFNFNFLLLLMSCKGAKVRLSALVLWKGLLFSKSGVVPLFHGKSSHFLIRGFLFSPQVDQVSLPPFLVFSVTLQPLLSCSLHFLTIIIVKSLKIPQRV